MHRRQVQLAKPSYVLTYPSRTKHFPEQRRRDWEKEPFDVYECNSFSDFSRKWERYSKGMSHNQGGAYKEARVAYRNLEKARQFYSSFLEGAPVMISDPIFTALLEHCEVSQEERHLDNMLDSQGNSSLGFKIASPLLFGTAVYSESPNLEVSLYRTPPTALKEKPKQRKVLEEILTEKFKKKREQWHEEATRLLYKFEVRYGGLDNRAYDLAYQSKEAPNEQELSDMQEEFSSYVTHLLTTQVLPYFSKKVDELTSLASDTSKEYSETDKHHLKYNMNTGKRNLDLLSRSLVPLTKKELSNLGFILGSLENLIHSFDEFQKPEPVKKQQSYDIFDRHLDAHYEKIHENGPDFGQSQKKTGKRRKKSKARFNGKPKNGKPAEKRTTRQKSDLGITRRQLIREDRRTKHISMKQVSRQF